jgi:hypothetical protein
MAKKTKKENIGMTDEKMITITLKYDARRVDARKAIDTLLDAGVVIISPQKKKLGYKN